MTDNPLQAFSDIKILDFDIFGIVGIRLENASPEDEMAVSKQLGPLQSKLHREPDITIRFVQNIPTPHLNFLGLNFAGFTEEGFYILKSKKAKAKVRIPFEQIGGSFEILCEHGLRRVPLLTALINLTMLKKGHVPLHASAFLYNDTGFLVTGWSKGGKTEALLSFADNGAQYVGDEWVFLSGDGARVYGLTEPIHVWDWQIKYLNQIKPRIKNEKKILFKTIHGLGWLNKSVSQTRLKGMFPFKILSETMPALERQLNVTMPPDKIFNKKVLAKEAQIDKIVFVMSHNKPQIVVEPCESSEIARRMVHSNQFELMPFFEYYRAFRFAFPELKNEFLEEANSVHAEKLHQALMGKEAYKVLHPYPVSLKELFHHMQPLCHPEVQSNILT